MKRFIKSHLSILGVLFCTNTLAAEYQVNVIIRDIAGLPTYPDNNPGILGSGETSIWTSLGAVRSRSVNTFMFEVPSNESQDLVKACIAHAHTQITKENGTHPWAVAIGGTATIPPGRPLVLTEVIRFTSLSHCNLMRGL